MNYLNKIIFRTLNIDWRYRILSITGHSLYKQQETSGKILEFIGTSGVGKSTLFRSCRSTLKKRWFFISHLKFVNRKIAPCEMDYILINLLNLKIDKIKNSDLFCPWHSLLDLKLIVRVMHDTMLVAHKQHPKGFAFDEGLFRHFPAEILQLGDEIPVNLWKDRAFVYLRAQTPETALSRLKSRSMQVAKKQSQRVRTDDQIISCILQDQAMFQAIVDRAVSFGCPVLVIDAEDPLEDSINKILNFESSLGREFENPETS